MAFIYNLLLRPNRPQLLLLIRRRRIILYHDLVRDIDRYSPRIHNELLSIMKKHNTVLFLQLHQVLLKQKCCNAILTILLIINNVCTDGMQSSVRIIEIYWLIIYHRQLQSFTVSVVQLSSDFIIYLLLSQLLLLNYRVLLWVVHFLIWVWNLEIIFIFCNCLLIDLFDWTWYYVYLRTLILSASYLFYICWDLEILR